MISGYYLDVQYPYSCDVIRPAIYNDTTFTIVADATKIQFITLKNEEVTLTTTNAYDPL